MTRRTQIRAVLAVVVLGMVLALAAGFVTAGESPNARYDRTADLHTGEQPQVVEPRSGVTVVAVQNGDVRDVSGELVAFRSNGTVLYQTERYSTYWDVDPTPGTDRTVSYVATERLDSSVCEGEPVPTSGGECRRNVVERLNLSTGERTRLYSHRSVGGRWHDVDVINDTHVLVADIANEVAFVVNGSSGIREWTWSAESYLSPGSGGPYDGDWVHLNDVEYLDDGRIMVDLRNQDQVAFVNRSTGVVDDWTLGSDDDHDVLHEQHNPDYIPESAGGPAVLVADSENDRLVEYQRENGSWNRTWRWTDADTQWPRDADRLPNDNTMITDTIGDRVFEVNPEGEIVWSLPVDRPYEAERLGSGEESAGGTSAAAADLESNAAAPPEGPAERFEEAVRSVVPIKMQNALLGYIFPWWMGFYDVLTTVSLGGVLLAWGGVELWWSRFPDRVRERTGVEVEPTPRRLAVLAVLALTAVASLGYLGTTVMSLF
ncbi:aryl-sulfate sulfotransferase [Halorussus halobius]|uniref:aryl-sulfate sulfotransferase n=1 Tax=Halorussus halobius TaxID=1710537 RepID=UPI001B2FF36E|nr:aryl-sulfate sulfotransferase [Halorussus halobius]